MSAALLISILTLAACGGGGSSGNAPIPAANGLSSIAKAGQALFFDKSLSASGQQSCGTCHVPSFAFAGDLALDHGLPVPLGGPNMDLPGFRNSPSLAYASFTPPFSIGSSGKVTGGFFRDGRSSSLAAQAMDPFVTAFEMANQNAAEVVGRLRNSPATLAVFIAAYGSAVLDNPEVALQDIGLAIAAFETEDASFHPFTSKYDAWLAGRTQLTAQEQQGLALFNNPAKGNCTACHPSQPQGYSEHALFTDFTYDNVGIPRNWAIPANYRNPVSPISGVPLNYVPISPDIPADAEYGYYDLGICGPFQATASDVHPRPDLSASPSFCGRFKVPTLRNIAITAPYFHNGVFATLREVIEWYVTRDINNNPGNNPTPVAAGANGNPYAAAGTFYVAADGTPDLNQYNDLPVEFDANVNIGEVPYTPPRFAGGQAPTLTSDEIDAVVAFLCTLTDGYDPTNPSAYNTPAQCRAAASAQGSSP